MRTLHDSSIAARRRPPVWVLPMLLLCAPQAAAQAPLLQVSGDSANEWFGHALDGIGDLNGDGTPDIVVGAPNDSSVHFEAGSAHAISGVDGAVLFSVNGPVIGSRLGFAVAALGDINNDGFQDVAFGAPTHSPGVPQAGIVMVRSGKTGAALYTLVSLVPHAWHGYSIAAAGDVNQDGTADVLVGASHDGSNGAGSGRATMYSGKDKLILWTVTGAAPGDRAGFAVSGGADVNANGVPDVAIGSPGCSAAHPYGGAIHVRNGRTGALLFQVDGQQTRDFVGEALDLRGDLDADGHADLLFGMRKRDGIGVPDRGLVRVVSGATQAVLRSMPGAQPGEEFGTAVAWLGDVDGDGIDDFAAGAPLAGGAGFASGVVRVVSGATGVLPYAFHGTQPLGLLGRALARSGDFDLDGRPDVLVGARRMHGAFNESGRVYVLPGNCGVNAGYGLACAGSGGFKPQLVRMGCSAPGALLTLELSRALGGSAALLQLGAASASVPLGAGCTLLVAPPLLPIGPIPLSGALPGTGQVALQAALPVPLPLGALMAQAFVLDPGAPLQFAASNGVIIPLGSP